MRRYGMPPGRGGWVRVVALVIVFGMVASLGYSALITAQTPFWVVVVIVALLIGVPIGLLIRGEGR